jgi:hypothetical protein
MKDRINFMVMEIAFATNAMKGAKHGIAVRSAKPHIAPLTRNSRSSRGNKSMLLEVTTWPQAACWIALFAAIAVIGYSAMKHQ